MHTRPLVQSLRWYLCVAFLTLLELAILNRSARAQVFYRAGRYAGPAPVQSIYYGNRETTGANPRNVTWYTVGGGYTSSLQTGLPWRRGTATSDVPERLLEAYPGSIARSSRVSSRDYYVRNVNRRMIDPTALPRERFDGDYEIAGREAPATSTVPPVLPAPLQNASSAGALGEKSEGVLPLEDKNAIPAADIQETPLALPVPPHVP